MKIPKFMTAAVLTGHGGFDRLRIRDDVPVPEPLPGEVLVKVGACGMNNTDINTRIGWYSSSVSTGTTPEGAAEGFAQISENGATWGFGAVQFPRIQGADVAGRIAATGEGVPPRRVGERVLVDPWIRDPADPGNRNLAGYLGSERDGGFAQYVAVPAENAFPIESEYSDVELATFPCSYSTAEYMLSRVRLSAGENILITGASGGVGSALVQLAKRRKARILALTRPSKTEAVRMLGAGVALNRKDPNLADTIRQHLTGDKLDVVADIVGGPHFAMHLSLLRRGGRYVAAGAIAGPIVEMDLRSMYLKDLELHGATVMPIGIFAHLIRYIEDREIIPLVADTFPISDIKTAQTKFLNKTHMGNLVMIPSPETDRA